MDIRPTEILTQQYGNLIPLKRLFDGKPRSILFDATKCIGCRHCVQACKDWNEHDRTSLYELSSTNWITMLPLGRERLVDKPSSTGSLPITKTMGIVVVAAFAANAD